MSFERDNIRAMAGYAYGEQPEQSGIIKLNTNENPYPPSASIKKVLEEFSPATLRRYPPATALEFRREAARLHQVSEDNIIATRGGDELLRLIITTFADPGDVIAMTDPTYSLYPVLADIQGCRTLGVPLDDTWDLDPGFAEKANRAGAALTFLVNPHAPSGRLLDNRTIARLASELNSVLLVDEAYVDFVDQQRGYGCLGLVEEFENLIFLRTLSKGYSLAGLRFGYGVGHPGLVTPMLEKTRDSYNLDTIGQQIALAALRDQAHLAETTGRVQLERARLQLALEERGFIIPASESNFLLATVPDPAIHPAKRLYEDLKDAGILVRYFHTDRLLDKVRITIGTPNENNRLLSVLDLILKS